MPPTHTQVSRLQTAGNLCREVFEQIKGELKNPLENYSLYWPEQKVETTSFQCHPASFLGHSAQVPIVI